MFSKSVKIAIFLVFLFVMPVTAAPNLKGVFTSWQDTCIVYGPGNDPALESAGAIDNMMTYWQSLGANDILLWRLSAEITEDANVWSINWQQGSIWGYVFAKRITDVFDSTSYAVAKANQLALKLHGGLEIYSVGVPPSVLSWWPGRQIFFDQHPECEVIDRQGNVGWGVPEYGVPLARQHIVSRFRDVVSKYNLSAIYVDLRSESYLGLTPPGYGDQFGFNPEVVNDFNNLYDVNILTDARFNYESPTLNINDPMVENWRQLRGGYLTQLFRDIRLELPGIKIVTAIRGGDYYGWPLGNMAIQWRKWVDEGLIDILVVNWNMGPPYAHDRNDTFFVDADYGTGILPVSTFRNYITAHNPQVVLYSSWYDSSAQGQLFASENEDENYLRTQLTQLRADNLARDGYLGFIKQNFDGFQPYFRGYHEAGNFLNGDYRYNSKLNNSQGWWGYLGDGNDAKPVVQNQIKRGTSGNAMMLTSVWSGSEGVLRGQRSAQYFGRVPDLEFDKLNSGWVEASFWVCRPIAASGLIAYLDDKNNAGPYLMGVKIDPDADGTVSYQDNTAWVPTQYKMPTGMWQLFTVVGDLDRRLLWMFVGSNRICLAQQAQMSASPALLNEIVFRPQGFYVSGGQLVGANVYVDDVNVLWFPNYAMPPAQCGDSGTQYLLSDINHDCYVDFKDLAEMCRQWLECTDPEDLRCDIF